MEPAMMMGDRFEGHIVQGHVDCIGTISSIKNNGNSTDFFIKIPNEYLKYVIPKGLDHRRRGKPYRKPGIERFIPPYDHPSHY